MTCTRDGVKWLTLPKINLHALALIDAVLLGSVTAVARQAAPVTEAVP